MSVDLIPPRLICVGTHHKTGTVWMRRVFRFSTNKLEIPRVALKSYAPIEDVPASGRAVLVNWFSKFSPELLDRDDLRGLHLIRDPRDVLLSGARYHQIAPEPGERPLHIPQDRFGGKSYQDQIKSLPNDREKLLFEMDNTHRVSLEQMLDWRYDRPNFRELRYEDLIHDTDCAIFGEVLDFLGFEGAEKQTFLDYYWENSLFGAMKTAEDRPYRVNLHVQSGKVAQWERKLPRDVAEIYAQRHGQALIDLGYERDLSWVDRCPDPADAPPLLKQT